jgi:hypothetical protein
LLSCQRPNPRRPIHFRPSRNALLARRTFRLRGFRLLRLFREPPAQRSEDRGLLRPQRSEGAAKLALGLRLGRNARVEEDLVDQLFNSTEKRLAQVLLLLANFGKEGPAAANYRRHQSGDPCGDDRHHAIPREPFHEQISAIGLHRLQKPSRSPQLFVERGSQRAAKHSGTAGVRSARVGTLTWSSARFAPSEG